MNKNEYTINQASELLELTPFYVRKCVREGKIQTDLRPIEGTKIMRHHISSEELEKFGNRERRGVGKRDDGRNKYTIYLLKEELDQVRELLTSIEFEQDLLVRANPPKPSNE